MSLYDPDDHDSLPQKSPPSAIDPWVPHRRELLNWFSQEAPSLKSAYEGAVILLHMDNLPGKVHFVCHVVRDIYAKLPEILDGDYRHKSPVNDYKKAVDAVAKHVSIPAVDYSSNNAISDEVQNLSLTSLGTQAIIQLLDTHKKVKEQPRSSAILERALRNRLPNPTNFESQRLINLFESERRWFVDRAHLVLQVGKAPKEDGLMEHFERFERVLYSLVGQFFTGVGELDDILQQANRPSD